MMRLNLSAMIQTSLVCTALAGCMGAVDEGAETEGTSAALASGVDSKLTRQGSGKCLDVAGGGSAVGTKIQQWTCNGTGAQTFVLEDVGGGAYRLKNPQSGKCAAVDTNGPSSGKGNGTQILLANCGTSSTQKFTVQNGSASFQQLVNTRSNKCLDVNGSSNSDGAKVQLWTCNGTGAQNWAITALTPGGDGDSGDGDGDQGGDGDNLVWRKANLTNFTSYPDPGSEECIEFNGCTWAGQFAFVDGTMPESWVKSHNIIAVHSRDASKYKLKTLRLRQGSHQIDATVYDMCSDSDCDGCCTENASETGFLIDVEKYTMQRFGTGDGIVDWACLDCN